jgi:ATP-dependent DNA ligase
MRTNRQTYIDSNLQAAREAGCDTIQLKFDGWWSRTVIEAGRGKVYTRTQRELPTFAFETYKDINCVIVGELMHGTNWAQTPAVLGKTFAFDLWAVQDTALDLIPYKDRYAMLRAVLKRLPATFIRVENFPIQDYEKVWKNFVTDGDYEGVVFRHSKGLLDTPVYRQKNVVVDTYTIIGFEEGLGKRAGMVGTAICSTPNNATARVGGGWDDSELLDMWQNQEKYLGRPFEAEGRKRFSDTGLLRHPNFVRWL